MEQESAVVASAHNLSNNIMSFYLEI